MKEIDTGWISTETLIGDGGSNDLTDGWGGTSIEGYKD